MNRTHALQHLVPLAQELDDNKVTPGLLGFVVFAAIALALWALLKNMNKHMKKIDFEEAPPAERGKGAARADRAAADRAEGADRAESAEKAVSVPRPGAGDPPAVAKS